VSAVTSAAGNRPYLLLSNLTLAAVQAEATGAHAKHGSKSMLYGSDDRRIRILLEEVGEVARELNDAEIEERPVDRDKIVRELLQSAAMCLTWVEAKEGGHPDAPPPAPGPAAYCRRCAASGVGACDDYPDCPAGRRP
jgi:hypothetical protein